MTSQSQNIQNLFDNAQADGLSKAATEVLVNNLNATTIAGATGATVDELAGDQVTLFVEVLDATGSMIDNRDAVIEAYNKQLQALKDSKAADSILMSTWTFNEGSTLIHGYLTLDKVPKLGRSSYDPQNNTALFDSILDAFTGAVAYGQSLRDAGINVKTVIVVISDGDDNCSKASANRVKTVAKELLNQEYTLAFVAFGINGKSVAAKIGFPAANVLDETSDPSGWRRALGTVSKSVIRASQTMIGKTGSQSFF